MNSLASTFGNNLPFVACLMLAIFALLLTVSWFKSRPSGDFVSLANIGEGTYNGPLSRLSDAALGRFLLVKIGTDARHVALAGVGDIPIGLTLDDVAAAEEPLAVALLGLADQTRIGVASEALAAGDFLVPAANGQIRKLPAGAGTYNIIGRAIEAASGAGEPIHFVPTFPIQRVV